MQTISNQILSTTLAAADGAWRNVSNFVASSIQITARDSSGIQTALTGTIWIEVSNDPNVNVDNMATQIPAPSAPTLSQFTPSREGNQQPFATKAVTYGVKLTYTNQWGETDASSASSLAVTAGNILLVAAPGPDPAAGSPPDTGGCATGYNVYVQNGSGLYILQNPPFGSGGWFGNTNPYNGPINVNQSFMLYAFQNTGVVPPATNGTGTPNWGANISGNLNATAVAGAETEAAVSYDTADGLYSGSATMVMWSPSCLYFNWIRVRVSGQTPGNSLQAFLFGQNG